MLALIHIISSIFLPLMAASSLAFASQEEAKSTVAETSPPAATKPPCIAALTAPDADFQKRVEHVHYLNVGVHSPEAREADRQFKDLIRAEAVHHLQTTRLFFAGGRVLPGVRARVFTLHGCGMKHSQATAMREIVRILSDPSTGKKNSTLRYLKSQSEYLPVSAEAFDLPFHGLGPRGPIYQGDSTFEASVELAAAYATEAQKETPGIPFIWGSRSSSAAIIQALGARYPHLVQGMFLMSPTLPGDLEVLKAGTIHVRELAKIKGWSVSDEGLDYADRMLSQTKWPISGFSTVPTLIMTGSDDTEVVELERSIYKSIAAANPNVQYIDYEGAEHNILTTGNGKEEIGRKAFVDVLRLIKTSVDQYEEAKNKK